MKPVFFVCIAAMFYAVANVLIEQKLAKFGMLSILACLSGVVFTISMLGMLGMKAAGHPVAAPAGAALLIALALGILYFFGDSFYLGAYTAGGKLLTVTTILAMCPVFACFVQYVWTGVVPNRYQVIGYLFGLAAVVFVAKGNLAAGK